MYDSALVCGGQLHGDTGPTDCQSDRYMIQVRHAHLCLQLCLQSPSRKVPVVLVRASVQSPPHVAPLRKTMLPCFKVCIILQVYRYADFSFLEAGELSHLKLPARQGA